MKTSRRPYVLAGVLLVLSLALGACAGSAPASQPEPTMESSGAPVATAVSEGAAPSTGATPEAAATAGAPDSGNNTGETPAAPGASGSTGGAGINEVTFTASEYRYEAPETIPAGWTRFTLENVGERPHDLMLMKPEAGKTISDVLQALQAEGPPDWAQLYGSVSAGAGEIRTYTVNLDPGDYIALSFGQNESGPPDAAQGMIHAFSVTGVAVELPADALPAADATVNMVDYAFVVTGALSAGEQTIRVMNTGKALHEMQVFRLNEGTTFEQFTAMLDQEPQQGQEPPFTYVGGPVMSPGVDGFITMELAPGAHVLVCFIPAPEHDGQPHYKLGMITQLNVE